MRKLIHFWISDLGGLVFNDFLLFLFLSVDAVLKAFPSYEKKELAFRIEIPTVDHGRAKVLYLIVIIFVKQAKQKSFKAEYSGAMYAAYERTYFSVTIAVNIRKCSNVYLAPIFSPICSCSSQSRLIFLIMIIL